MFREHLPSFRSDLPALSSAAASISVGLLAFLFSQIDLRAMLAELAGVRPGLVMLMAIAIITTRLVGAFRWYLLLPSTFGDFVLRRREADVRERLRRLFHAW
jgi:hypothetical protein